jgi:hypothetical protein
MPSPTKGYCELRQLEVVPDQLCDYYDALEPEKHLSARCPLCTHFIKKPKQRKNKPKTDKDN